MRRGLDFEKAEAALKRAAEKALHGTREERSGRFLKQEDRSSAQGSKHKIGILKSIWTRNEAGAWVCHDLKGIDLKPREGFSKDYFAIENEVNLMTRQPGHVMNSFFAAFGTTEFLVRQSIVPVVAWNDGDEEIRCIGTGFFISASGLLMTAAHALRDPVEESYTSVTHVNQNSYKLGDNLHFGVLLPATLQ